MTEEEKRERRMPVTVRAVIGRVNRRLKKDGQRLVAKRGRPCLFTTGHYYLVSTVTGRLIERDVDLELLARRENALELWEEIQPKVGE